VLLAGTQISGPLGPTAELNPENPFIICPYWRTAGKYIYSWGCLRQHEVFMLNILSAFARDSLTNSLHFQSNLINLSYLIHHTF